MRTIDADYVLSALGVFTSEEPKSANFMNGIKTAMEIVEDAPTVGGWISVKDRLPDVDRRVLVSLVSEWDGHRLIRPELGYTTDPAGKTWFITTWKEWAIAIDSGFTVTHWIPMPEPPEEVSGDA